jgi:uncharacterized surface protein with fasciclin (FAS1) repeats
VALGTIVLLSAVFIGPFAFTANAEENIVDTATADGNFTTLVAALGAAGLDGVLSGPDNYTVFAPYDPAFEALPDGVLDALLADVGLLTEILTYHVVPGIYNASEVVTQATLTTVQGQNLTINTTDGVKVDGAAVVQTDIMCTNGIIHVIDSVMIPQLDIVDTATVNGNFETLITALVAAGLNGTLAGTGPFTVFAPNDDAFNALPDWIIPSLLNNVNVLTDVLTYHVVSGLYTAADLSGISTLPTLQGTNLEINNTNGVHVDAASVIAADIMCTNGIIHVIDGVLLPYPLFEVQPISGDYLETVTLEIYNATAGDTVELWKPGGAASVRQDWADGNGRVTFSGVYLDAVGDWVVRNVDAGIDLTFTVRPEQLNMTVTPTEQTFTQSQGAAGYEFDVAIRDQDGDYVSNCDIQVYYIDENGDNQPAQFIIVSNVGGNVTLKLRSLQGIGVYNITATKNTTGDATPELGGYVHAMIMPNTLVFTDDSTENAQSGFPSKKMFTVKYNDTNNSIDWSRTVNVTLTFEGESNFTGDVVLANGAQTIMIGGEQATISIVGGKLTVEMKWPDTGTMKLMVKQNYAGAEMVNDASYEYTGETTFEIVTPPDVNIMIEPTTVNVTDMINNAWELAITILGDAIDVYGDPENLSVGPAPDNQNITDRISIEGNLLYTPPAKAYTYMGNGVWHVKVYPTKGGGMIYINVTWPGRGTDNATVNIVDGGHITLNVYEVIVDNAYDISVTVKTQDGTCITFVDYVKLYYEDPKYYDDPANWTLIDEQIEVFDSNGVFTFPNLTINQAAINIIVAVNFRAPGETYAYARIRSNPAHDLEMTLSPAQVLAGENTEFTVNVTRGNTSYTPATGVSFEYYILNETERQKLLDDDLDLDAYTPVHTGTDPDETFKHVVTQEGTYYVYIRTDDKKHDNLNDTKSFTVIAAEVTATPDLMVKNVDTDFTMEFTVTWGGEPVNGTLIIHGIQEVGSFETYVDALYNLAIVNGMGNLTNVSATAVGNITFQFLPAAAGSAAADADGTAQVTTPDIEILEPAEKVAFLSADNLITLQVKHPRTNTGIEGLEVHITAPTNPAMTLIGETDEDGKIVLGIVPLQTGMINIYVDGELAGEIEVVIGLKIVMDARIKTDTEVTIVVTTAGGTVIEGATVKMGDTTLGTTDSNGEITYTFTTEGTKTITATKSGYHQATKDITVTKETDDDDDESVPGFEFIGIAAALVVVALIIRRRRH